MNIRLFRINKGNVNLHFHHQYKRTKEGNLFINVLTFISGKELFAIIVLGIFISIGWNE